MCFLLFFQKSQNYFLIAAINVATQGPLYTCLVLLSYFQQSHSQQDVKPLLFAPTKTSITPVGRDSTLFHIL